MRILIAFYSRTGGTEKVSKALEGEFKKRGHVVDVEKIVPQKERSAWAWHWLRLFKSDCPIQPIKIKNVDKYDLICVGSPNWTRLSLPVARYLKEIDGLRHKSVGFFSTATLSAVIEKYFLSAYLLDMTFSQLVARKEGRVVNTLLLSSLIKKWRVDSEYGQKLVKEFCDKLEVPLHSLKKYFLEKKEVEDTRFLVLLFSFVLLVSLLLQLWTVSSGRLVLDWSEFFILFAIEAFIYFVILTILTSQSFIFLGKYLAGLALIFGVTVLTMFLLPSLGLAIVLSYILILILFIFFRDPKVIVSVNLAIFLAYIYLSYFFPLEGVLHPLSDLPFISASTIMVLFIAKNLQDRFFDLLAAQEEVEMAKAILEIKVEARTRELKELSASLEEQVNQRTASLQEKIEDLERFNRLTVGRELKMIELKDKIGELEGKIEKSKKNGRKKISLKK
jgi:hypothetical protein